MGPPGRPAVCLACALVMVACEGGAPVPEIDEVAPGSAYTDRDVRLVLRGGSFLPAHRFRIASGARVAEVTGFSGTLVGDDASHALVDFGWRGPGELSATVPSGLPAGWYGVDIVDPRGARASLDRAFQALGADAAPPGVEFEAPAEAAPLAPGVAFTAQIAAWDTAPGAVRSLTWQIRAAGQLSHEGECPMEAAATVMRCRFVATVPEALREGDLIELRAIVLDDAAAANRVERSLTRRVRARPTLESIRPSWGGTGGGNDVVVRGSGFLPGTRVLVGGMPLVPGGGILIDERTISGRTPPHAPGPVDVALRTPLGDVTLASGFFFEPPPLIQSIEPAEGDPDGSTLVRVRGARFSADTRILFGDTLATGVALEELDVVGAGEIRGVAPRGRGRTSVWAFDPSLGWSRLPGGFAWLEPMP